MTTDVNIPPVSAGTVVEPVVPVVPPVTPPAPAPGSQTDPALLLKSLQEERGKRQSAEADLTALRKALASGEASTEEGKVLKGQIAELEGTIASMKSAEVMRNLETKFPALKDKAAEFEEFRKAYPPGNDESVAKIFLAENNLLEVPITRKGVEKPGGGGRNTSKQGMTLADVENLRVNNFRKYSAMLKAGEFKDITE